MISNESWIKALRELLEKEYARLNPETCMAVDSVQANLQQVKRLGREDIRLKREDIFNNNLCCEIISPDFNGPVHFSSPFIEKPLTEEEKALLEKAYTEFRDKGSKRKPIFISTATGPESSHARDFFKVPPIWNPTFFESNPNIRMTVDRYGRVIGTKKMHDDKVPSWFPSCHDEAIGYAIDRTRMTSLERELKEEVDLSKRFQDGMNLSKRFRADLGIDTDQSISLTMPLYTSGHYVRFQDGMTMKMMKARAENTLVKPGSFLTTFDTESSFSKEYIEKILGPNTRINEDFPTATERANTVNFQALISLADKSTTKNEATEFGLADMSSEIKAQLEEMVADERKAVVKQAAGAILNVLRATKVTEEMHIASIRAARASIAHHKKALDEINRAKAYSKATDNYLPLVGLVNVANSEIYGVSKELRCIPEDWVSAETPAIDPPEAD
jgi:hypothetical protein